MARSFSNIEGGSDTMTKKIYLRLLSIPAIALLLVGLPGNNYPTYGNSKPLTVAGNTTYVHLSEAPAQILYVVASDDNGYKNYRSDPLLEAITQVELADGKLNPGDLLYKDATIKQGVLTNSTGKNMLVFASTAEGKIAALLLPGENLVVGNIAQAIDIVIYCPYCRCYCSSDTVSYINPIYIPNGPGSATCYLLNGEKCEIPGHGDGTFNGCVRVWRACVSSK
jgi:hypothetical protein